MKSPCFNPSTGLPLASVTTTSTTTRLTFTLSCCVGDCVAWESEAEDFVARGAWKTCALKAPIQEKRHRIKETDRLILATVHIQDDSLLPALPRHRIRRSEGGSCVSRHISWLQFSDYLVRLVL